MEDSTVYYIRCYEDSYQASPSITLRRVGRDLALETARKLGEAMFEVDVFESCDGGIRIAFLVTSGGEVLMDDRIAA